MLLLVVALCPSCLDNECENSYAVDRVITLSQTGPDDIGMFRSDGAQTIRCTVELENVCLLSLINVDVNMRSTKPKLTLQETPSVLINIDKKLPATVYNRSQKTYKNTELLTYSCSSVAESNKATVTITVRVFDTFTNLDLSLIQSLRVVITYFELPGGSNP